ncbi:SMB domain-containing protein [Caerostris darwini]|uniref:SMB domain-containing protein n=1 Tax=Caerostris darwini TaxID=1538125 RepID=A0AAV4PPJ2_9ARAC|nr:SMB domain-containing protein [Caerostris darwini]
MVNTCKVKGVYVAQSSLHVNTDIYTHCRNAAEDHDNPFLVIPVTSKVTRTTYKNYFCAVCNEDIHMDRLTLWDLSLEGQSNASEVHLMSALRYSTKFKSWVVMRNGRNIFKSSRVSIGLEVPDSVVSVVQFCRKDILAKCATAWTEETEIEKCGSYMAVVAHCKGKKEVLYRNPHFAICNRVEVSSLSCGRCSWEDNIRVKEGLFRIVLRGRIMSRYRGCIFWIM